MPNHDMDDLIEEWSVQRKTDYSPAYCSLALAIRTLAKHIREIEAELDHHDETILKMQVTDPRPGTVDLQIER